MEPNLTEMLLRIGAAAVALGGLLWVGYVVFQHYRTNERPIRLGRMMRRLGLDLGSVERSDHEDHMPTAGRLCLQCRSKSECDAWLRALAEDGYEPPDFCPNASYLRLLVRETSGSA
jgi:hypothetical protein